METVPVVFPQQEETIPSVYDRKERHVTALILLRIALQLMEHADPRHGVLQQLQEQAQECVCARKDRGKTV